MSKNPTQVDPDEAKDSPGVAQPETIDARKPDGVATPRDHLPDPDAKENAHLLKGTAR